MIFDEISAPIASISAFFYYLIVINVLLWTNNVFLKQINDSPFKKQRSDTISRSISLLMIVISQKPVIRYKKSWNTRHTKTCHTLLNSWFNMMMFIYRFCIGTILLKEYHFHEKSMEWNMQRTVHSLYSGRRKDNQEEFRYRRREQTKGGASAIINQKFLHASSFCFLPSYHFNDCSYV